MSRVPRYLAGIVLIGALALPSVASAQTAAAALYPRDFSTCQAQLTGVGNLYANTSPAVSILGHVPVGNYGQWVRVRWYLYKMKVQPFTTATRMYTGFASNWWYGVASATGSPQLWYEYAYPLGGGTTLVRTGRVQYGLKPNWGINVLVPKESTRYYAWMQYEWIPLSRANPYSTVTSPDRAAGWAANSCYWQYPTSWAQ